MSRSQRRTGNPVSLFPFLAVLLCTMGSLSLLLLVTTHRIRHDAVLWAEAEALARADIEKAKQQVMVVEAPPVPTVKQEEKPAPQPAPPAPVIDLNAQLKRIVTGLVSRRDSRKQELQRELTDLNAVTNKVAQASQQLERVEQRLSLSRAQQRRHISQVQALSERHASVSGQVDQAEKQLRQLQEKANDAATRYAFVPYDGTSGTTRRPILIECTNKGMKFLPEGITLSAADLEGSSIDANPLLAGAQSLVDYWSRKGRVSHEPEPYVLLVVRPSGSTAYYAARKLLTGLGQPSGYELLGESEVLDLPKADPQAVAVCRNAVDRALAQKGKPSGGLFAGFKRSRTGKGDGSGDLDGDLLAEQGSPSGEGEQFPSPQGNADQAAGTPGGGQPAGPPKHRSYLSGGAPNCDPEPAAGTSSPGGTALSGSRPLSDRRLTANQPASVAGNPAGESTGEQFSATGRGPSDQYTESAERTATTQPAGSNGGSLNSGRSVAQHSGTQHNGSQNAGSQNNGSAGANGSGDASEVFPRFGVSPGGSQGQSMQGERRWGVHGPRANIGFQRRLVIYVDTHQLVVGNEPPIPIGYGESREQLFAEVLRAIEADVRTWGNPPEHFYWVPEPHFVVSPGGNQHYEPLKSQSATWGLSSSVEFRLNPFKPSRGPE